MVMDDNESCWSITGICDVLPTSQAANDRRHRMKMEAFDDVLRPTIEVRLVQNNQLCHEAEKFAAYSATVHTTIVIINPIFLGVLQVQQQYAMLPITANTYFGVLSIYAILFVGEFKGRQLQLGGSALRFLGHSSHLIGALAAILLISVVSVALAWIILALYLFVWIPTVIFDELKERESRTTEPQVPA